MWLAILVITAMADVLYEHWSTTSNVATKMGAAAVVAITNSALLLGADKWLLRSEAIDRLCANCQGKLGLLTDALFYCQSGLTLILLFLIGLALRNRFRIGGPA
jgi:hypothetical protein